MRLTPITLKSSKKLKAWLEMLTWVELDPDAVNARVAERGTILRDFILADIQKGEDSISNIQSPGNEHAFDKKLLERYEYFRRN